MDPDEAYELHTGLMLDGRPTLNLASFVTTWMEPQAEALIHDTLRKNHIDHEDYPAASLIEEACVHMLGDPFNHARPTRAQAQLAQSATWATVALSDSRLSQRSCASSDTESPHAVASTSTGATSAASSVLIFMAEYQRDVEEFIPDA